MNQQVPETPRRRSPRHTTSPIRIPTPEIETAAVLETPRRRSPKRSIALLDSEVKEEEKPVPTIPLRRSPRRISALLTCEQKEEVLCTPRRSTRNSPSHEMKQEEPIPDTPSRRSPSRIVIGAALDLTTAPQSTTSSLEQAVKIEFPITEVVSTPRSRVSALSSTSTPVASTTPVVKDTRVQAPRTMDANIIFTKSEQASSKSTPTESKPMVQTVPVPPKQSTPRKLIVSVPEALSTPKKSAPTKSKPMVQSVPPKPSTPRKLIVPVPEASPVILSTPKKRARLAKDTPRTPIRTPTTMSAPSNFPTNMIYESPVRVMTTPKKIGTPPSVTLFGSPEVKHHVSEWQPIFDKKPKRSPTNRRTTTFASPTNGTPSKHRSKPPLARTSPQEDDFPMSISHILSHQEVDTEQSMHANVARNLNVTCFGPQSDDDMALFLSRTVKDSPAPRLKREIPTDFNAVSNAMNDLLDGAYNHLTQESPAPRQIDVKYAATPEFAVGASKAVPVLTPPKAANLVFRRRVLTTFLSSGWRSVPPPMNGRGNYYYTHPLINGISLSREDVEQYAIDYDVFQNQINPLHVLEWAQKNRNSPLKTQDLKRKLLSPSTQRRFSFTN
ncbi:hypothetical protein THRCLA_11656 [Thraustotheca clavata]|uniref:Uncharacterized protein n=1 Tax=Thraustotheca clavata TaxID=74557 RepID=A0A1V9Y741_9STRA|nr:hypothetical protein THRCLA_11656 [Thraustotheca clavata]